MWEAILSIEIILHKRAAHRSLATSNTEEDEGVDLFLINTDLQSECPLSLVYRMQLVHCNQPIM